MEAVFRAAVLRAGACVAFEEMARHERKVAGAEAFPFREHDGGGAAYRALQLAVELIRPGEVRIFRRLFRTVHLQRHGDFRSCVNERGYDADLLRRHAVEAIDPDMGAAELL